MTRQEFARQMDRLAGLRFVPADFISHWEALQDLPTDVLEQAVTRAQRTRVDFPTPYELRIDADAVRARVVEREDRGTDLAQPRVWDLPIGKTLFATREWKYYCDICSDSGYESRWCGDVTSAYKPWQKVQPCGNRKDQYPHEYVIKCACWSSNPELIRKRAAQAEYAEKRAQR